MTRSEEKHSRREREIMDVLFRVQSGTVTDIRDGLASPPSYSAVRATLGILVDKNQVKYARDGRRFVYTPIQSRRKAGRTALEHIVSTFFDGSAEGAVATLLAMDSSELSSEVLSDLKELIERAKEEGR